MRLPITILLLLAHLCSLCQQKKIDSLLSACNNYHPEDSVKVVCLLAVIRQYSRLHNLEAVKAYAAKAIAIAEKLPQRRSLMAVYLRLGIVYHGNEKFIEAIDYYNKLLQVATAIADKMEIAGAYVNLSAVYASIPDYQKALECNKKAIDLYSGLHNTDNISSSYMNVGGLYLEMKKPLEAIAYTKKAQAIFRMGKEPSHYGLCVAYDVLGNALQMATDDELKSLNIPASQRNSETLKQFQEGLRLAMLDPVEINGLTGVFYKDLGLLYHKNGDDAKAEENLNAALSFNRQGGNREQLTDVLYTLGTYYSEKNNYNQARTHLLSSLALAREMGLLGIQQDALSALSHLFEKSRPDSALLLYRQSIAIKDSLFSQEKEKEITRKQLQLDFAVKEHDYQLQQQLSRGQLRVQEEQISFDKKIKFFLAIAIALILVIAALVYNNQRKTGKLNKIIRQQKNSIEQLGHVKDKIFSVVGHDMRTPVNSLISFIDILDNGKMAPEKLAIYAKELRQNLSYTSSLMNNLLNWAASQMQGFKPAPENFAMALLLEEVCGALQAQTREKKVTIHNNVQGDAVVYADKNMMALVIRNLVSNAIKYSFPGGAITISATTSGNGCTVTVGDEGTGMPADAIAFFNSRQKQQADSVRGTANEKGTGLGLLLCKTFTEQMGGTITAAAQAKGMQFCVWLPATG